MKKLNVIEIQGRKHIEFRCPGCKQMHIIPVNGNTRPNWTFNGSEEAPVLTPSILARSGHHAQGFKEGEMCWCKYEEKYGRPSPFECGVCHSFVGMGGAAPGEIIFLGDCTHELKGQTVPLPEFKCEDA